MIMFYFLSIIICLIFIFRCIIYYNIHCHRLDVLYYESDDLVDLIKGLPEHKFTDILKLHKWTYKQFYGKDN